MTALHIDLVDPNMRTRGEEKKAASCRAVRLMMLITGDDYLVY
jgi:hypothetical protein